MQLLKLTLNGTVLKWSNELVLFGVTFDKIIFVKHLRSISRAASQRFGIMTSPGAGSAGECSSSRFCCSSALLYVSLLQNFSVPQDLVTVSVSLWNDFNAHIFDSVGLEDFKSRDNIILLAWPALHLSSSTSAFFFLPWVGRVRFGILH